MQLNGYNICFDYVHFSSISITGAVDAELRERIMYSGMNEAGTLTHRQSCRRSTVIGPDEHNITND